MWVVGASKVHACPSRVLHIPVNIEDDWRLSRLPFKKHATALPSLVQASFPQEKLDSWAHWKPSKRLPQQ